MIKIQQKEHGEILSSLTKAAEFHKADTDKLTLEVSHLSEEMKAGNSTESIGTISKVPILLTYGYL